MKNNKLIKYKSNVFIRIFNFFKRFFSRKNVYYNSKDEIEKPIIDKKANFLKNIQFKENEEEKRLKTLQLQYDNGEIDEEDLSEEDMNKLIEMYKNETEELNQDTLRRKIHIEKMLKELKESF